MDDSLAPSPKHKPMANNGSFHLLSYALCGIA